MADEPAYAPDTLERIASALERLSPATPRQVDWLSHPGYICSGRSVRTLEKLDALPLDRLRGIDRQKEALGSNVARHAAGHAAHDVLLWGARGMGKSALLRACVAAEQARSLARIALVELDPANIDALPDLLETLGPLDRSFILFLDDLVFDHGAVSVMRHLRSALEGSLAPRPANVRLAVTSNHRAILARTASDQPTPLHERDALDDTMALADRFGMRLGFHPCSKDEFLDMIAAHAAPRDLTFEAEDALSWSRARGPMSGRIAWQYVVELAGRAGEQL